jgi:hypothetical protein
MHDFDVLLYLVGQDESVGISLCLSKDDALAIAAVADQNVSES